MPKPDAHVRGTRSWGFLESDGEVHLSQSLAGLAPEARRAALLRCAQVLEQALFDTVATLDDYASGVPT